MSPDDLDDVDEVDRAEAEQLRVMYRQRVSEVTGLLELWQPGRALSLTYRHVPTQSPFTGTSGNSVFEIQLFKDGLVGTARLRCIACWRVNFLTFWSPTHIQVQYREAGFVPILVSDGDRLWVECTDVELVTAATASPPPTPS